MGFFEDQRRNEALNRFLLLVLSTVQNQRKEAIQDLISSLVLEETHIKTALRGVYHSGPCSTAIVPAPPDRQKRTGDRVLAEDIIDLPQEPWMLTAGELEVLYVSHGLNTRQIAVMARVSHSTIIEHMKRYGIMRSRKKKTDMPKFSSLLAALLV